MSDARNRQSDAPHRQKEAAPSPGYRSMPNPLPSNRRYKSVLLKERLNWLLLTFLTLFSPIALSLAIARIQHIPLPFFG